MKLRLEQLQAHLRSGLAPVYIVSGDEPLQGGEALDAIRAQAKSAGFDTRELFSVDSGFHWSEFSLAADSYSLFGDRRILDLRLSSKPDKEGAETLSRYADAPAADTVLMVSLPKISASDQKAKWFQALDAVGVFIQIWPLEGQQLFGWLDKRLNQKDMLADRSALAILAARVEGNLLAAAQEIEKLHVLYGNARIDDDMMRKAVADSARYDVYDLADAAMMGHPTRAHRILAALRSEGIASAVTLWSLARDLRVVATVKFIMEEGSSVDSALSKQREKLFDKRRQGILKAVDRLSRRQVEQALILCAKADRVIKGVSPGDEWDAILAAVLCICGHHPLHAGADFDLPVFFQ